MPDNNIFPKGVRALTFDETGLLGVEDKTGRLFWGKSELQVVEKIKLRGYEVFLATVVAISSFGMFAIDLCEALTK